MNPATRLQHEFVTFVPDTLQDETVYVSMPYATAVHKCCCGCGNKVVTPLSPVDWKLIFDGVSVSLYPSIGNWDFECRSHYWVRDGQVRWVPGWSHERVEAARTHDLWEKEEYFNLGHRPEEVPPTLNLEERRGRRSLWEIVKGWILRRQ